MPDYKKLYYHLFARLADAVEQIELQNYGTAREILIQVQQEAEHAYLSQNDEPVQELAL